MTEKFKCQQTVCGDLSKIIKEQAAEIDRLDSELKATSGAALSYKAEIERLTGKRNADPMDFCGVLCRYSEELITKAKAEAVKECIEKIKARSSKAVMSEHGIPVAGSATYWISEVNLYEIEKEMVGET